MTTLTHDVTQMLSLWQSPIDKVGIAEAESLQQREPRCSINYNEDLTQITAFNYAQYIYSASGDDNLALDDMFQAMTAAYSYYGKIGGLAYIPQLRGSVKAPDPSTSVYHQVTDQCNMVGSGTGGYNAASGTTNFYHFEITPLAALGNVSQFLTCSGSHTSGGTFFRGLSFRWLQTGAQSNDICIYAGTWNVRALDCNFTDCPTAIQGIGESCGLERCTIQYTTGAPNNAVAVYLFGPECFAVGPGEYRQDSVASGGPTGCTAIALGGGDPKGSTEHAIVASLHLSDWSYAISYHFNHGVNGSHVTNVEAESSITCVLMQPTSTGSNNQINGEKYTSCTFEKSGDSTSSSPIVFIDTNGQSSNNAINDIEFLNCSVYSTATGLPLNSLYCYQITSGSNIRIIGGTASNAGPGVNSAGIAITPTAVSGGPAGPGGITILGVNLNASYPQAGGGGAQSYALLVSANLQDLVTLDDCRMNGYGSAGPVLITATANVHNYLFIRNCQGYNDQNTTILSGVTHLPTVSPVSAATASSLTGGTNYYGPSLVVFTNSSSLTGLTFTINSSISQTVPPNAFVSVYLASPYDTIQFSHTLAAFAWIGK